MASAGATLHGDGVSDAFFQFLWQKDELNFGPTINLPDTVIYKFGQPVQWFFSGLDGKVKRKHKQNLVNVRIEEAMTKKVIGSDIVAYYIATEIDDETNVKSTSIEYFDRDNLHDFLYNRWKENSGILQRFVEPKGTQNVMVRAIWSPKVCLLERRVNNRQLHDKRFGLYERAITYEGPEFHSSAAPLRGNVLPSQVQRICENIVTHVGEVSFQKHRIRRMVLNFKVDAKDRVWLQYASSIRLEEESFSGGGGTSGMMSQPLNIDNIVKLPKTIKLSHFASHGSTDKEPAPIPFVDCVSCGKKYPSDQFHPVPYKTIIAHFEQVINLLTADMSYQSTNGTLEWPPDPAIITAAGGVGFGGVKLDPQTSKDNICLEDVTIPPVVRQLHTKLTSTAYRRYRKDPLFLYKTAMCCESCFLVYAEMASMSFQIAAPHKKSSRNDQSRYSESRRGRTPSDKWLPVDDGRGGSTIKSRRSRGHNTSMMSSAVNNSMNSISGDFIGQAPPNFPDAIRSVNTNYDDTGLDPGMGTSTILERTAPPMTEEVIQKREDAFFKEMLNQHKPKDGHPLTHLITAQSKLESLTIGAPDVNDNAKTKKKKKKSGGLTPYEIPQKFVEVDRNGKRRTRKSGKKKKADESDVLKSVNHSASNVSAPAISASAQRHRDFLLSTLQDIQDQLAAPTALKTLVESQGIEDRRAAMEAEGEDEELGDDALPPDAQGGDAVGLFKQSLKIGDRLCNVTAFASHAWEGGPYQISFIILYPAINESWRIAVTEEDLNLDKDASLATMPLPKLKAMSKKVVEQLSWVGTETGGDLGLVFLAMN
ncbi:hypothetical protein TrST_g4447 [Triparma strigata]|uniref:Uncharacterized protein n=1 Tax=Triparma strigata TaxID=1606541 RepID=A0A9W7EHJ8_9STRA|nr:hypothetical protein TrST_g4447 [Triparma strigata]